jgi:hypothetical protein
MDFRALDSPVASSREHCPRCAGTVTAVAALTIHFVSLRCVQCGEVWMVRQRRQALGDSPRSEHQYTSASLASHPVW